MNDATSRRREALQEPLDRLESCHPKREFDIILLKHAVKLELDMLRKFGTAGSTPDTPSIVSAFLRALSQDSDPKIRSSVAKELGNIAHDIVHYRISLFQNIPQLIEKGLISASEDRSPKVRRAATKALRKMARLTRKALMEEVKRREGTHVVGSGKYIEVPNDWGVGDGTPLLVEQRPDLEGILSDPNPQPPQRLTEGNRSYWESQSQQSIRNALAIAYLAHPDPQVRASTISLVKDIGTVGIGQMLVDLLADSSSVVRSAAVQAIWDRAESPDPDVNSVAFTLRCLRDEIEGTGYVSHMSPQAAWQALEMLRDAHPERRSDFDRWMIYAWCRSDDDLANHGYELLNVFSQHGTFLNAGKKVAGHIGVEIGSVADRQVVQAAMQATLGSRAGNELDAVWKDSLKAYVEMLQGNGDIDGLIELLSSKEWKIREMAVEALGDIGDSRAVSALQKTLDELRKREEFHQKFSLSSLLPDSKPALQKVEAALSKIQSRVEAEGREGATKQEDQTAVTLQSEEVQGLHIEAPSDDSSLLASAEHESVQPEKESLLRRCGSCEQEVHPIAIDGRQYCPNCGIILVESQETTVLSESEGPEIQPLFCPHCEKVVSPSVIAGESYCPDCGLRL
jgi:HEAT repeat protein/predicted RNA-binding Zn-ribbon protein involved in translation (DUF1610 family)